MFCNLLPGRPIGPLLPQLSVQKEGYRQGNVGLVKLHTIAKVMFVSAYRLQTDIPHYNTLHNKRRLNTPPCCTPDIKSTHASLTNSSVSDSKNRFWRDYVGSGRQTVAALSLLLAVSTPIWNINLDLSKAFDRVSWDKLWVTLRAHGLSDHLV